MLNILNVMLQGDICVATIFFNYLCHVLSLKVTQDMKRKKDLVVHSAGGAVSGGQPLTGLPLASTPQTPEAVPQDQPGVCSGAL